MTEITQAEVDRLFDRASRYKPGTLDERAASRRALEASQRLQAQRARDHRSRTFTVIVKARPDEGGEPFSATDVQSMIDGASDGQGGRLIALEVHDGDLLSDD